MSWLERLLFRWLHAAAPADWADSVIGDLREEIGRTGLRGRLALSAHLTRVAARFTLDAAVVRWRERSGGAGMATLVQDLRYTLRSLRLNPGFSLVAVLTLAIAIGANTAIYSALSSVVLRPLPFPDGDRYVFVWHTNPAMGGLLLTPPRSAIERWRRATHVFDAVESYSGRTVVVTGAGEPEELSLTEIQPTTFATLAVRPALGRTIVPADQAPDAPPVVVISHAFWTSRFGRDPGVPGRTLQLGSTSYTIAGVMPRRFALPMGGDTLWTAARGGDPDDSENTIARLAPGVSVGEAQAALDAMGSAGDEHQGWRAQVMAPADYNGHQIRTALFVLMGAVGLLLLMACVNVANLMFSRIGTRAREMAMRHALGASRWRMMRLLLLEGAAIAAAGCLAGLTLAYLGIQAIGGLRPARLDVLERIELDAAAVGFAAAVSVVTALLCGLAPALTASRGFRRGTLQAGGRSATPAGHRLRGVLTASQVALALMLLVGASLLLRSYAKLTAVDPGYDPTGVLTVRVSLPSARYAPEARQVFFDEALAGIRAIPGVVAAAVGSGIPPELGITTGQLEIEGRPSSDRTRGIFAGGYVSPAFFATLRIPVLDGRVFTGDDVVGRDRVVVLGASFARDAFGGERPIGRRIRLQADEPWSTVVGVVGDVKAFGLADDGSRPQIYHARAQLRPGYGAFAIRTDADPLARLPAIKAAIWALDPQLPLRDVATAGQLVARSASQARFNLALLAAFAGCGLLLAVVGVFGVMAIFVGERRREVGIRMALGATRGAVGALVLRQTGVVVLGGAAVGVAGAVWLSQFTRTLLFQVAPTDPASFIVPALAIALAAGAAVVVPVRRAMVVDPAIVLRGE
jgi:putative ABC transport system permease protein